MSIRFFGENATMSLLIKRERKLYVKFAVVLEMKHSANTNLLFKEIVVTKCQSINDVRGCITNFYSYLKIATISHSFLTLDCEIKAGFYKLFFYFISCLSLAEIQRRSRHELHYPFNGSVKTSVLLKNKSL